MTFTSTAASKLAVLRRVVAALQASLQTAGYSVAIDGDGDGDYGAATELAVTHFQAANQLEADGIAGPTTVDKLPGAPAMKEAA